jgi:hypothetical protein
MAYSVDELPVACLVLGAPQWASPCPVPGGLRPRLGTSVTYQVRARGVCGVCAFLTNRTAFGLVEFLGSAGFEALDEENTEGPDSSA